MLHYLIKEAQFTAENHESKDNYIILSCRLRDTLTLGLISWPLMSVLAMQEMRYMKVCALSD